MIETIKNLKCDGCQEYLETDANIYDNGILLRREARAQGWIFLHSKRYADEPGDYCSACVETIGIEDSRHKEYRRRKNGEKRARNARNKGLLSASCEV